MHFNLIDAIKRQSKFDSRNKKFSSLPVSIVLSKCDFEDAKFTFVERMKHVKIVWTSFL